MRVAVVVKTVSRTLSHVALLRSPSLSESTGSGLIAEMPRPLSNVLVASSTCCSQGARVFFRVLKAHRRQERLSMAECLQSKIHLDTEGSAAALFPPRRDISSANTLKRNDNLNELHGTGL